MHSLFVLMTIVAAGACVKGNPFEPSGELKLEGGTLDIEGCNYRVTTRAGAEAPVIAQGANARVGVNPSPRHVHLGFIGDPKKSMIAQWRTEDDDTRASVIRYAEGEDLSASALSSSGAGVVFTYRATGTENYTVHQGHMCGLKAGTAYSYQVGSERNFSPVYTFRTAPDVQANPDTVSVFGNLGDSRDGYEVWSQLVEELRGKTPDLILFSGDAVTIGLSQLEWEEFFDRGEPLFARTPVISAHGNHEVNAVNFYAQFAMPGDQETFGFDWGHAHITVANDTPVDFTSITGQFRQAIETDFEASKNARWKLFMHHQPIYSASTRHGSSTTLKAAWEPLIDQYEIDLVLNGHDHDYERSRVVDGTTYVVSGAAAKLRPAGSNGDTVVSQSVRHFLDLSAYPDRLVVQAVDQSGAVVDGVVIPAG